VWIVMKRTIMEANGWIYLFSCEILRGKWYYGRGVKRSQITMSKDGATGWHLRRRT
jgi:hypothetical protein